MSEFTDREKAFESKFGLDETLEFKIAARAAHLLAAWAAGQMGLKDGAAAAYTQKAIDLATSKTGHEQLLAKIEADLKAKGIPVTHHGLEREMNGFTGIAREQVAGKA
jgi:hypothetical protein